MIDSPLARFCAIVGAPVALIVCIVRRARGGAARAGGAADGAAEGMERVAQRDVARAGPVV